jgi:hypothetical protein
MVNTMKNSPNKTTENFLFYSSLLLLSLLTTYNFSNYIYFYLNVGNLNVDSLRNCSFMIFSPSLISNIANYEISSFVQDIYVIPEFKNIHCLGKISNITYIDSTSITAAIYTNSKFINHLIALYNFSFIFLHYFRNFFSTKKFLFLLIQFNTVVFISYFNSLNISSFSLLIMSFVIIYLFKYEN